MANEPENKEWQSEVSELLTRAAELCVENSVDMDPFMRGAAAAYFAARPGLREQLEEMQLRATLQTMRDDGKIARA